MATKQFLEVQRADEGAWCIGCERDEHEDGTPAAVVLVAGPVWNQIRMTLCGSCLQALGRLTIATTAEAGRKTFGEVVKSHVDELLKI